MAESYCQSKKQKDTRKCTPDKVMDYLDAGCPALDGITAKARPAPPCNCKEQDKKQPNDIPSCEDLMPLCQKQQKKNCSKPQGAEPTKCQQEPLEPTLKCQHGYPVCPHGCVLLANEKKPMRKPFIKEFTCKVTDGGLPNPPSGCKPAKETKKTCDKEGPMPNFCGKDKPDGCCCKEGPKPPAACCKEAQKKKC